MNGKGVLWVTDPKAERPVRVGTEGVAAVPAVTVSEYFRAKAGEHKHAIALAVKREGTWKTWTHEQYEAQALQFAAALVHVGHQRFDCVTILGFNSPEWFIADIGAILAGGIACGIYTTNGPDACGYIINHSQASVVVVENESQLKKILQIRSQNPQIKAIVQWIGDVAPNSEGIYSWAEFLALGQEADREAVRSRMASQTPGQTCTLIYTSGTTGPPKAVMLSHDNCVWTAESLKMIVTPTTEDVIVSYLPLSHIAAQMCDIYLSLIGGASVYFAQPDALKGSLGETLKEVRPTIFLGVPRVWEKIAEKMKEIGKANGVVKRYIAAWARSVGLYGGYALQRNQPVPWGWWLANNIIFGKVRQALGLDRARLVGSSAAPISRDTLDFFLSLNIPIYEIYGMSESSGPQTATYPAKGRTGSAGVALPGTDIKLASADAEGNGEVCWKGRNVFMGYMYNDQATAETIDSEGFLHSGDIGKFDSEGFLYITGRIKELIITAGGENIPPVLIEEEIKKEIGSVISNVMVVGDRRKFLAAVITLRAQPAVGISEGEYPFTDQLHPSACSVLEEQNIHVRTISDAQHNMDLHKWLERGINAANKRAASNAQQVRKFVIIDQDFALENDTLTPSLKLKRRVAAQKYAVVIDKMYEDAEREMAGQN